ncbi:MAG TPA: AbrB family transcriptional regulator [Bacillota bacterium]|nr:AbrB family transcriptional regulator [Bacillota bacterium]
MELVKIDRVIITLALTVVGGSVGYKLGIPAGTLLGSMMAVGAASLLGVKTTMPESYNIIAQMILGGFLGLTITRDVLTDLKTYLVASLLVLVLLSVFGILTGCIVSKLTGLELYTSLLGSAPGGMHEIVALSQAYEVDHSAVAVIQTVRRIMIVLIYPLLVTAVSKLIRILYRAGG